MGVSGSVRCEDWELEKPFIIARGPTSCVQLVVVEIRHEEYCGRGEACPSERFGETPESTVSDVELILDRLMAGARWEELHDEVGPGAARNAVDCALWDLRSKQAGRRAWELLGLSTPSPVSTVFTVSLGEPKLMAEEARGAAKHEILKLKLGAPGDVERVSAVRQAVPEKRLIVDVNEGWRPEELENNLVAMARLGVELVEQPLPAVDDDALAGIGPAVLVGADESCETSSDLQRVARLYDVVNIKLDKAGGLTEAMRLLSEARRLGLQAMIGCRLGTSLAMAPGVLVAQSCSFVDLDAPLLIGHDREPSLDYSDGFVAPSDPDLWG